METNKSLPLSDILGAINGDSLGAMNVGVCVWQLEEPNTPSSLRLVVCTPAAARFMQVKREDVLGKRIHEGFPGSENMPLPGLFTRVIETGQAMALGDVPYIDEIVPDSVFSIQTHPLPNRCVCVEFTNVTEQRKAEKLVAEQHQKLTQAVSDLWGEMDLARKIQTVLLPSAPSTRDYEVSTAMRPAATVGGDYVDVVEAGGSTWLLIGDVSGHGVSAGLIMMMAQTALRTAILGAHERGEQTSPARILSQVNRAIHDNLGRIGQNQYMTINAIQLRGGEGLQAGLHLDLLIYRAASGEVESIETQGVWLGVVDDASPMLQDSALSVAPGDYLLACTDGLLETRTSPEPLGEGRLKAAFGALAAEGRSPDEIVQSLLGVVQGAMGGAELRDDVTLLVARRRGASA